MFENRRFLLFLATAMLVAACGGGGDTNSTLPDSGAGNGNAPGENGDGNEDPAIEDQVLAGRLIMVGNSLVYPRVDRTMCLPITLERFEDAHGMNDVAPGFTGNETIGPPYRPGDGIDYAPPRTVAPAAPISAFGIRVNKRMQPISANDIVVNQRAIGRIAVELVERNATPQEIIRYVINDVELSTNANGELAARVLPNAQMHVYGRNAAGTAINATVPVREDAVSMLSMERIPDNYGDRTSEILLFDFEKAFSQAGSQLDALNDIRGYFDVRVTLSSVKEILRPESCSNGYALTPKQLIGQDITVGNQPLVSGAGLAGSAWIRSYDPDPPPDRGYNEPGPDICPSSEEDGALSP